MGVGGRMEMWGGPFSTMYYQDTRSLFESHKDEVVQWEANKYRYKFTERSIRIWFDIWLEHGAK